MLHFKVNNIKFTFIVCIRPVNILRSSGLGCRIAGHWFGALALADDVILLSPTVQGLQSMVNICSEHAAQTDLVFSTDPDPEKSKTMCIAFSCKNKDRLSNVKLNGEILPWKDKVNHLGTTLASDCTTTSDVMQKRATFIQTCYNLNQEFSFATEEVRLKMLRLYNTAFYGSNSWLFRSEEVLKFGRTWNVNLRILFDIPHGTHCWIVEELAEGKHLRQMIMSRFVKYVKSVAQNKRPALKSLYSIIKDDVKSPTGSNIRSTLIETGTDPRRIGTFLPKDWRVYVPQDDWTVPLLWNLLQVRGDNWEILFDDEAGIIAEDEEVEFMINAICTG